MGGIQPTDLIKFFVSQGYSFRVGFMKDDEVTDEVMVVDKDNIDEFVEKMEEN